MGVLRANVDGQWVDVTSTSGAVEEVAISQTDPGFTYDLWYDTDAPPYRPIGTLPTGGAPGQALVKNTATDYDAGWKSPNPPRVKVRRVATMSAGTGVFTNVIWDTEDWDVWGFHAPNDTKIIVPAGCAGIYHVSFMILYHSVAGGYQRFMDVIRNNTEIVPRLGATCAPMTNSQVLVNASGDLSLNVGDNLEVRGYQDSPSVIPMQGSFAMFKIADS